MPLRKTTVSEMSFSNSTLLFLILICFVGILDHLIGPEISTSLFYVLPIGAVAWYDSRLSGYFLSLTAAIIWLITDHMSGHQYSSYMILFWNAFVRLSLFVIISHLMASYRRQLKKEEVEADTDVLTGAYNSRGFYERAENERLRLQRFKRPFTIAFIDLDNFKKVNDTQGHKVGDELLIQVVSVIKSLCRSSDLVGRLGGDEFAVLFVETDFSNARGAIDKIRNGLHEVMSVNNWPVTTSIGMVTYNKAPESVEQMIKLADDLMYLVKKNSKNDVYHIEWQEACTTGKSQEV